MGGITTKFCHDGIDTETLNTCFTEQLQYIEMFAPDDDDIQHQAVQIGALTKTLYQDDMDSTRFANYLQNYFNIVSRSETLNDPQKEQIKKQISRQLASKYFTEGVNQDRLFHVFMNHLANKSLPKLLLEFSTDGIEPDYYKNIFDWFRTYVPYFSTGQMEMKKVLAEIKEELPYFQRACRESIDAEYLGVFLAEHLSYISKLPDLSADQKPEIIQCLFGQITKRFCVEHIAPDTLRDGLIAELQASFQEDTGGAASKMSAGPITDENPHLELLKTEFSQLFIEKHAQFSKLLTLCSLIELHAEQHGIQEPTKILMGKALRRFFLPSITTFFTADDIEIWQQEVKPLAIKSKIEQFKLILSHEDEIVVPESKSKKHKAEIAAYNALTNHKTLSSAFEGAFEGESDESQKGSQDLLKRHMSTLEISAFRQKILLSLLEEKYDAFLSRPLSLLIFPCLFC